MRPQRSSVTEHLWAFRTFVPLGNLRPELRILVRVVLGKVRINGFPGIEMLITAIAGKNLQKRNGLCRWKFRRFPIVEVQHVQIATGLLQEYPRAEGALEALVRVAGGVFIVVA